MQLSEMTQIIMQDSNLHARWLNTFSFLEYIGWRKIVKSQEASTMTLQTLRHGVEEARHALSLKRICLAVGGDAFDNYQPVNLLCGREAEDYFQAVDHTCAEALSQEFTAEKRSRLTYLYVTWLIELRALQVYGPYSRALAASEHAFSLKGLLKEEDRHLLEVEAELQAADPDFVRRGPALKEMEGLHFEKLLQAVREELALSENRQSQIEIAP